MALDRRLDSASWRRFFRKMDREWSDDSDIEPTPTLVRKRKQPPANKVVESRVENRMLQSAQERSAAPTPSPKPIGEAKSKPAQDDSAYIQTEYTCRTGGDVESCTPGKAIETPEEPKSHSKPRGTDVEIPDSQETPDSAGTTGKPPSLVAQQTSPVVSDATTTASARADTTPVTRKDKPIGQLPSLQQQARAVKRLIEARKELETYSNFVSPPKRKRELYWLKEAQLEPTGDAESGGSLAGPPSEDEATKWRKTSSPRTPERLPNSEQFTPLDTLREPRNGFVLSPNQAAIEGSRRTPLGEKASSQSAPPKTSSLEKQERAISRSPRELRRTYYPKPAYATPQKRPSVPLDETPERSEDENERIADEIAMANYRKRAGPAYKPPIKPFFGKEQHDLAIKQARRIPEMASSSSDDSDSPLRSKKRDWQNKFQCMQSHDIGQTREDGPNARTIQLLQELAEHYEFTQDKWRTLAYRKAIAGLKKEKTKIMTKEEAIAIPGVGERLAQKIEEIATTDRLRRLEYALEEPHIQTIRMFTGIYGVGYRQAQEWVAQGHRTLDDLSQKAKLTEHQRVGIEHYEDFQQRIPCDEIKHHEEYIRNRLQVLHCAAKLVTAGSYRRGASTSGDIDFMITCPRKFWRKMCQRFRQGFLMRLQLDNYIKHIFASGHHENGSKVLVAARLPREVRSGYRIMVSESGGAKGRLADEPVIPNHECHIWRRVDFLLVPEAEFGAALLYFTGNNIFNRSMRLLASRKGMRLNQHGLFENVARGPDRKKLTDGTLVESADERRIFAMLDVPWREPEERNP